jgi:hypothetical protein
MYQRYPKHHILIIVIFIIQQGHTRLYETGGIAKFFLQPSSRREKPHIFQLQSMHIPNKSEYNGKKAASMAI